MVMVVTGLNTSEFNRNLRAFQAARKRSMADVINQKMTWILRRAIWYTPFVPPERIATELMATGGFGALKTKSGRVSRDKRRNWVYSFGKSESAAAPLLALIINKRRGKKGLPGLYGEQMTNEMRRVFAARRKSTHYFKSGWLPAFNKFLAAAPKSSGGGRGKPPVDRAAKIIGKPKGTGQPASPMRQLAIATNSAWQRRSSRQGLVKVGLPALQRAYNEEVADMKAFIARKLEEQARRLSIRTA